MCEDDDRLRSLYRALRSIHFDPLEKPSPWENLTAVLWRRGTVRRHGSPPAPQ